MNELDGRKMARNSLEMIRIRDVKRVDAVESPEVVIKALWLTRPRIYEWLALYREGGIDAQRRSQDFGSPLRLHASSSSTCYIDEQ